MQKVILYLQKQTKELMATCKYDPKQFWKLLKDKQCVNMPNITGQQFYDFFERVSNPADTDIEMNDSTYLHLERSNNNERCIMFPKLNELITEKEVISAIKRHV